MAAGYVHYVWQRPLRVGFCLLSVFVHLLQLLYTFSGRFQHLFSPQDTKMVFVSRPKSLT
jgi:hypothetical protein